MSEPTGPIPGSADAIRPMLVGKIERILQVMAENSPPNDFSEIAVGNDSVSVKIWEYGVDEERTGQGEWRITVQRVGP